MGNIYELLKYIFQETKTRWYTKDQSKLSHFSIHYSLSTSLKAENLKFNSEVFGAVICNINIDCYIWDISKKMEIF